MNEMDLPECLLPFAKATHEGVEITIPVKARRPTGLILRSLFLALMVLASNLFILLRPPLDWVWEGLLILLILVFSAAMVVFAVANMAFALLFYLPERHVLEIAPGRLRLRKGRLTTKSKVQSRGFADIAGISVVDDLLVCEGASPLEVPLGTMSDEARAALVEVVSRLATDSRSTGEVPEGLAALRARAPRAVEGHEGAMQGPPRRGTD